MKIISKLTLGLILSFAVVLFSCSDDDKGPDEDPSAAHKVVFKAEISNGNIINASYGIDDDAHTALNLSGTSWSSPELTVPAGAYNVNILVNAAGATDNAVLTVQIFVDGQLKAEKVSPPSKITSALVNYKF